MRTKDNLLYKRPKRGRFKLKKVLSKLGQVMKKPLIILTAFFIMPPMIVNAYQQRGYFAIGGEWLVIPLIALIVYGLAPSIKQLWQACFEESEGEVKNR